MNLEFNCDLFELNYDELQAVDGGGFYEFFMRGAEILFVGTCAAAGGAVGGGIPGASVGTLVGEAAWEYMFGNSMAGDLFK